MNKKNRCIIIRQLATVVMPLLVMVAVSTMVPTNVFAHGGAEHVVGTVTTINGDVLSVKTVKGGTVEVHLDGDTTYLRGEVASKRTDIKPGDRVVIHAAKKSGVLFAHEVKGGTNVQTTKQTK
jgi:hypothetical protein